MRKLRLPKIIIYSFIFLCLLLTAGCGRSDLEESTESTQKEDDPEEDYLFVIMENDMVGETLVLYSCESGLEYRYPYSFSTQFTNKYGDYSSHTEFIPGTVVKIAPRDREGYLTQVQISDKVWKYEKVRRFSIDEERGVFTIAEEKYSLQGQYFIFSGDNRITTSEISKDDVLTVVGRDKEILTIMVTTGHGTLALQNTEVFEGSFLQLNKDIFAVIKKDMELEVPEGIYILKVANDGWGGTTEIEILRGGTTEVDLELLKGEGKKKGLIRFRIDVEEVEVYVDYELIDHTEPIELAYGTHVLEIKAEGYTSWKKHLAVNSEDATIIVELEKEKDKSTEEETEETTESVTTASSEEE